MLALVRLVGIAVLLTGFATAQLVDCRGCHGYIIGVGGQSNGVTVMVDNMSAIPGSCADTEAGNCMPALACTFGWDLVVLITPGTAGISRIKICQTDARGRCIGNPAVSEAPLFQDTNSFVRGYAVACGWKHEQDIVDLLGNLVGGVSVTCSVCKLIVIPE